VVYLLTQLINQIRPIWYSIVWLTNNIKGSGRGLIWGTIPEETDESHEKKLSRSVGRDLNLVPPKHEGGVLPTRLRRWLGMTLTARFHTCEIFRIFIRHELEFRKFVKLRTYIVWNCISLVQGLPPALNHVHLVWNSEVLTSCEKPATGSCSFNPVYTTQFL
jgi:hypothetical protein